MTLVGPNKSVLLSLRSEDESLRAILTLPETPGAIRQFDRNLCASRQAGREISDRPVLLTLPLDGVVRVFSFSVAFQKRSSEREG